jgi:hypothetical protein
MLMNQSGTSSPNHAIPREKAGHDHQFPFDPCRNIRSLPWTRKSFYLQVNSLCLSDESLSDFDFQRFSYFYCGQQLFMRSPEKTAKTPE